MPFSWTGLFGSQPRYSDPPPVLGKRKVPSDDNKYRFGSDRNDQRWDGIHAAPPPDTSNHEEAYRPLKRPTAGRMLGSNPKTDMASHKSLRTTHQGNNGLLRSNHAYGRPNRHEVSNVAALPRSSDLIETQSSPKQPSGWQKHLDSLASGRNEGLISSGTALPTKSSPSRAALTTIRGTEAYMRETDDPRRNIFGDLKPRSDKQTRPTPSQLTHESRSNQSRPKAAPSDVPKARTAPVPLGDRIESITIISDSEDEKDNRFHTNMRRKIHLAPAVKSEAAVIPCRDTPNASKFDSAPGYPDRTTGLNGPETKPSGTKASVPENPRSDFDKEMEGLTRIKERLAALKKQKEERAKVAEEEAKRQEAKREEIQRQEAQRREALRQEAQLQEAKRREAERVRKAAEAEKATKSANESSSKYTNGSRPVVHATKLPKLESKTEQPSTHAVPNSSTAEERLKAYNTQKTESSKFGTMSSSEAAALIQASAFRNPRDPRNQDALGGSRPQKLLQDVVSAESERKGSSQTIRLCQQIRPERVTDDDWLIFNLRNSGWSYPDIVSHWPRLSHTRLSSKDTARKKYIRMRATYPDLVPSTAPGEDLDQVSDLSKRQRNAAIAERLRNNEAIGDLLALEATDDERAKNRREALAGPPPKDIPLKPDPGSKSRRSDGYPTTGGKQISDDHYRYIMATLENQEADDDGAYDKPQRQGSPPRQDDKIHFAYRVLRRTVWRGQDPETASWVQCGGEHDVKHEASKAAIAELDTERSNLGLSTFQNYTINFDKKTALFKGHASGDQGMIDIRVDQFERTLDDGREPSTKAGWVSRELYDVVEKRTMFYLKEGDRREEPESGQAEAVKGSAAEEVEFVHDIALQGNAFPQGQSPISDNAMQEYNPSARSRSSSPFASSIFDEREGDTSTAATSFACTSIDSEQGPNANMVGSNEDQVADDDWTKQLDNSSCSGINSKPDTSKTVSCCHSPTLRAPALEPDISTRTKEVYHHREKTVRAVGSVFGSKTRANAEAAKRFLELQRGLELVTEEEKRRMWFVQKVQEARRKMDERLEELEDEVPGYFEDVLELDLADKDVEFEMEDVDDDGDSEDKGKLMKVVIEVKTIARKLENPRNLI